MSAEKPKPKAADRVNAHDDAARQSPYYVRDCSLCGCPLTFMKTAMGKTIPLDLRAHIYAVIYHKAGPGQTFEAVRSENLCFVSHFFTCPNADEF